MLNSRKMKTLFHLTCVVWLRRRGPVFIKIFSKNFPRMSQNSEMLSIFTISALWCAGVPGFLPVLVMTPNKFIKIHRNFLVIEL